MFTSAQVSSLVGGQQAMFSNAAAYSHQISGTYGVGQQQQPLGGGQSNPYPSPPSYGHAGYSATSNVGSQIAGGMGAVLPGALGGLSMAGSFMGGPLGMLDPFQTVGGAFMRGAGGMGGIGSAFAGGGLGAGMGAIGSGLVAAAPPAAAMYAAYKAVDVMSAPIREGAQTFAQVGGMANQHFGSQFGSAGARPGGQMGSSGIKATVGVLEELTSGDMMTTMSSLKRLMDQAGQMGMLSGITNADQFKQRFGSMVKQVKEIAKVMGSSLEEAAPLFGQMQQMGIWSTKDVMGTAASMKSVGAAAAPAMMQSMQSGSQMAYAMGGNIGAGAMAGRNMFMNVNAAVKSGSLSREQLMNYTGGVGGNEGQAMMAQDLTGIMSQFTETPMGRLMMAGLGETKNGEFTGRVDQKSMDKFLSGDISVQGLQNRGMKASGSEAGATSFSMRKGKIGQEMMAKGGLEAVGAAANAVLEKMGRADDSEAIQARVLQLVFKTDERQAEMLQKLARDLPQIRAQKLRQLEASLQDTAQRNDIRQNRSWQGFKDSIISQVDDSFRGLRDLGGSMAEAGDRAAAAVGDAWYGRKGNMSYSAGEKRRHLLSQGSQGGAIAALGVNMGSGVNLETSMAESIRGMDLGIPLPGSDIVAGMAAGALGLDIGGKKERLSRSGIRRRWMDEGDELGQGEAILMTGRGKQLVGQMGDRSTEVTRLSAAQRGAGRTSYFGDSELSKTDEADLASVKGALRSMVWNKDSQGSLRGKREQMGSTGANASEDALMAELKRSNPEAAKALSRLAKKGGIGGKESGVYSKGGGSAREKSLLALALKEESISGKALGIDYDELAVQAAEDSQSITPEKAMEAYKKGVNQAAFEYGIVEGDSTFGAGGVFKEDIEQIIQGGEGGSMMAALSGGDREGSFARSVMREGGEGDRARRIKSAWEKMSKRQQSSFKEGIEKGSMGRQAGIEGEAIMDTQRLAEGTSAQMRERSGELRGKLGQGAFESIKDLLGVYSSASFGAGTAGGEVSAAQKKVVAELGQMTPDQQAALESLGGVGAKLSAMSKVGQFGIGGTIGSMKGLREKLGFKKGDLTDRLTSSQYDKLVKGAMEGGLDRGEQGALKEQLMSNLERMDPSTMKEGRKDKADTLSKLLDSYALHNTEFVRATGEAILKMKNPGVMGWFSGDDSQSDSDKEKTKSSQMTGGQ